MPKLIDHQAREREVAEAAWRVLLREGIRGLSVRTVASEAGLATGSLRRSFATQAALLTFCVELVELKATERIQQLHLSQEPIAAAQQLLEEVLPLDQQRRVEAEVWLVLTTSALTDRDLAAACAKVDAGLRQVCELAIGRLAQACAITPGRDPDQEIARLHALLDGLALHLVKQPADQSTEWASAVIRDHLKSLG